MIAAAVGRGLELVALTDHNTAENTPVFCALAAEAGVAALAGVELTTVEEVHVVCLFREPETALAFGREVYKTLPPTIHDPARFGDQVIVDKDDMIEGALEKSLFGASTYSVEDALERVRALGGLFIPAHIDRSANSILSQLGFVPDLPFDAVELIGRECPAGLEAVACTAASDAHRPEDVGRRYVKLEAPPAAGGPVGAAGAASGFGGARSDPARRFEAGDGAAGAGAFDALVSALREQRVTRVLPTDQRPGRRSRSGGAL